MSKDIEDQTVTEYRASRLADDDKYTREMALRELKNDGQLPVKPPQDGVKFILDAEFDGAKMTSKTSIERRLCEHCGVETDHEIQIENEGVGSTYRRRCTECGFKRKNVSPNY